MNKWIDDTGWVHYHPSDDYKNRQITDGFGDSPHHTGFYITPMIWNTGVSKELQKKFILGYHLRNALKGFVRHPRTRLENGEFQYCGKDQIYILYAIRILVGYKEARIAYDKTSIFPMPHQWLFVKRQLGEKVWLPIRWLCDSLEVFDILFDLISPNNSSIIKNHFRYELAKREQPTVINRFNAWALRELIDVKLVFKQYFTYKHGPKDSPPPIHLEWFSYER